MSVILLVLAVVVVQSVEVEDGWGIAHRCRHRRY